ncbi:MAG: YidC/Oxa1 family membrane protein insertase [Chloroflexota bacterium]|nr:YidC/Oxa1 family membrane protein insertase [Chloroflexota bacterium]
MTTQKFNLPKPGKKNLILIGSAVALMIASVTVGLVELWNVVLLQPMLNFIIILSNVFFDNFGIAIVVLVIIVRLLMLPVTLKQLHSTKAMSALQPKMKEIQKKYEKDKVKLQQEIAKVYKESGVSPLGCLWPMLIQLPIWIALYQSILKALAATPEEMLSLSQRLYSSAYIQGAVPLDEKFLWLDLGRPDPYFIMAVLVGATMWVLQKMSTVPTSDPKQQSMNNMLVWMMPLMFAFFTIQFPSGLALFWVVSNIIGIITQYFITGWGSLFKRAPKAVEPTTADVPGVVLPEEADSEGDVGSGGVKQERLADGKSREKRKDRRRSRRAGSRRAKRKS